MTNSTPTLNLLALIHQYTTLHDDGSTNLKGTYWNLTKARRERGFQAGGGGFGCVEYSVEDVREELRAQAVLERKEPDLVEEDGDEGEGDEFILHFDGGKSLAKDEQYVEKKETDGLRRRGNNSQSRKSEWTEESPDELKQILVDPLTLFGVPPPALRIAQARSRDSLAYYVEVANLAREIVRITNGGKGE